MDLCAVRGRTSSNSSHNAPPPAQSPGGFFTTCTERWYDPLAGEQEEETCIPSSCGPDEQWSTVTISPADGRKCKGCGTFTRTALPERRSISPQTADPHEVLSFIKEVAFRAQTGATGR